MHLNIMVYSLIKSLKFLTYVRIEGLLPKEQKKVVKRMKKACRSRCLSLHAGVDASWEEFGRLVDALKELEKDKSCGFTATGLLRRINNYEFWGTLGLLKHVLPNLSALSKTFQTGCLNFSRITLLIEKCKDRLGKIVADGEVLPAVKSALSNILKNTGITLSHFQKERMTSMVKKYIDSI